MSTPRILKNFNCFVNGKGMAGVAKQLELPEIAIKTDAFRAGGMDADAEVDMGQEAMTAKYTFEDTDSDVAGLVGLNGTTPVRIIARGSFVRDSDNTRVAVLVELGGKFKKLTLGSWESGKGAPWEYEQSVTYFRLNIAGADVIEIDVINMKRIVGGVDQLAGIRADIGL